MDFYLFSVCVVLVICICCYTSFRSGRDEGLQLGIERSLQILIEQKIVYLDEVVRYISMIVRPQRLPAS